MKSNFLKKGLTAAALTTAIFGAACETKKTKQIGVLYDQSKSKFDGCDCLAGVLERTLKSSANTGAKITFFKLGELSTGFEPKVVEVYDLPKNRRVTEGKSAVVEKTKEIVADFQTKCRAIERTNDTPLAQALSKVVGFFKQNGCDENLGCQIIAQSDLQESIQSVPQQKTVKQIFGDEIKFDNAGIAITFYGIAEVEEKASKNLKEVARIISNTKSRGELKEMWKRKFASPELVNFFDFCTFDSPSQPATK